MELFGFGKKKKKQAKAYVEPEYRDLIEESQSRLKAAMEAEEEQRQKSLDDLKFCDPDQQWSERDRSDREDAGRPCLVIDRINPFVHQIVNDIRQAKPQPQVNPVGDGASKETAEVLQGMIRHIAYMSNGDTAIDTAAESQVRCGVGYFRVLTGYVTPDSFDQEIIIGRIPNPFCVYMDPSFAQPDGSDAEWAFISTFMSREQFRAEFPGSKMDTLGDAEWAGIGDEAPEWAQVDGAGCRVVEYFKKVRTPQTIIKLSDGTTVKESDLSKGEDGKLTLPEGVEEIGRRQSMAEKVMWYKMNAIEVLEKAEWPGKYIPVIPVLGTELNIDGKRTWAGLVRSAKDAQKAYNYWKSGQAEAIALAPKAPWVGAKGFMGSMRSIWQQANRRSVAALEYEVIDDASGRPLPPPQRQTVEPAIGAITQAMVGAVDDLKATTGIYDPSLGNRESSQSGIAIRQLQRQGQAGNYHYMANLGRSITHLGRILVDLIPKVYDTPRIVRIVNPDETSDQVTINAPTKNKKGMEAIYKVGVGTYDVTISVGPSYQTKRQENLALLESMMTGPMGQTLAQVAPDLVVSMMDFQIANELQERLKKLLPPQFRDDQQGQPPIPPQVKQMMDQSQQMIEQLTKALNEKTQELDSQIAKAKIDAEAKVRVAEVNAKASVTVKEMEIAPAIGLQQAKELIDQMSAEKQQLEKALSAVLDEIEGGQMQPPPPQPGGPAPQVEAGPAGEAAPAPEPYEGFEPGGAGPAGPPTVAG